jgi:hypothetical protein
MAERGAALLLLREADVVRRCGLVTAARALDLVRSGAVINGIREDVRLTAHVRDTHDVFAAWLEYGGAAPGPTFAWGCSCPQGVSDGQAGRTGATGGHLACVHVAALMTEWVHRPASFREERIQAVGGTGSTPPERRPNAGSPPPALRAEPTPDTARSDVTALRDQLGRLPAREMRNAGRAVLGDAADEIEDETRLRSGLYDALTDPVLLAALCARLDESALLLLRGVHLNGGALTESALAAVGQRAGLAAAGQIVARHALRTCCLLFPIGGDEVPVGWAIPPEIESRLDLGLGLRALDTASSARLSGSSGKAGSTDSDLRSLCLALTLMARTLGQVRSTGSVARPAAAGELPVEGEEASPAALEIWARAASVELGLARFAHRLVRAVLSRSGSQHPALALDCLPPSEWAYALRMATEAWLRRHTYAELSDLAGSDVRIRCEPRHAAFSPSAVAAENTEARARIAQAVARVRPDTWHTLDDFVQFVWRLDPWFLRGRQRAFETPSWWLVDAESGRPLRPEVETEWTRAEGQYVRALVRGPLRWLGAVELESDAPGAATIFRCTEWAPYLLEASSEAPAHADQLAQGWGPALRLAGQSALSVQPLALVPAGDAPLAGWAEVAGVRDGRLSWQLSANRFCANLDAGRSLSELVDWLRTLDMRDGTRCAPQVAALLKRWQQQYGASRIERELVVVEAQDEPSLREALSATPDLATQARTVAPGVAVLPRGAADRLEQVLADRGYLV